MKEHGKKICYNGNHTILKLTKKWLTHHWFLPTATWFKGLVFMLCGFMGGSLDSLLAKDVGGNVKGIKITCNVWAWNSHMLIMKCYKC